VGDVTSPATYVRGPKIQTVSAITTDEVVEHLDVRRERLCACCCCCCMPLLQELPRGSGSPGRSTLASSLRWRSSLYYSWSAIAAPDPIRPMPGDVSRSCRQRRTQDAPLTPPLPTTQRRRDNDGDKTEGLKEAIEDDEAVSKSPGPCSVDGGIVGTLRRHTSFVAWLVPAASMADRPTAERRRFPEALTSIDKPVVAPRGGYGAVRCSWQG
jgi:hypothetical protein